MKHNYSFLQQYRLDSANMDAGEAKAYSTKRHIFFPVPDLYIEQAVKAFEPFPQELLSFYQEIGFGFFHRKKSIGNCLLDPMSVAYINQNEGYLAENDVAKEYLDVCDTEKFLLFFQTSEQQYLSISRETIDEKNTVWFKEYQLADSLADFLNQYAGNRNYILETISYVTGIAETKGKKYEQKEKEAWKRSRREKYIGIHRLLDT